MDIQWEAKQNAREEERRSAFFAVLDWRLCFEIDEPADPYRQNPLSWSDQDLLKFLLLFYLAPSVFCTTVPNRNSCWLTAAQNYPHTHVLWISPISFGNRNFRRCTQCPRSASTANRQEDRISYTTCWSARQKVLPSLFFLIGPSTNPISKTTLLSAIHINNNNYSFYVRLRFSKPLINLLTNNSKNQRNILYREIDQQCNFPLRDRQLTDLVPNCFLRCDFYFYSNYIGHFAYYYFGYSYLRQQSKKTWSSYTSATTLSLC